MQSWLIRDARYTLKFELQSNLSATPTQFFISPLSGEGLIYFYFYSLFEAMITVGELLQISIPAFSVTHHYLQHDLLPGEMDRKDEQTVKNG